MQSLKIETGGRPLANDDLQILQNLSLSLGLPTLLTDLLPCIISGCQVYQTGTVWNVSPGMVWTGTQLLDFPGQSNVSLPAMFAPSAVQAIDQRAYQTGGTKTCIQDQVAELIAPVVGAPNLVLNTYGALTYWHRLQEKTRSAKLVEWVATLDTQHYDVNGLGKPGTTGWGWGLCDGQGGRVDLRGRFVAGLDLSQPDYNNIGNMGGAEKVALTTPQLPQHSHQVNYAKNDSPLGGNGGNDFSRFAAGNLGARPGSSTASTEQQGGNQAHENRPPFYVLAARQWVGY